MSTKCTLFYGKDFHLYRDYADGLGYLPHLEIKGKEVELPRDLAETLLKLCNLHAAVKATISYTEELDENDGGIFAINLKGGKNKEFKKGKMV